MVTPPPCLVEVPAAPELLFVGGVFCDLVFQDAPTPQAGTEVYATGFTISPGGVANRAVAAARAGAPTALVAQLGDDPIGRHVEQVLRAEPNLDLRGLRVVAGWQSAVTVALTGAQDRSFITYEQPQLPPEAPPGLDRVRAVHIGVSVAAPPWITALRAAGALVVGGVGWDPHEAWSETLYSQLAEVDAFIPNEVEAISYTRAADAVGAAKALAEHVPLVVVTRGARGAVAIDAASSTLVEVPAVPVRVIDPTGAGDVFSAAFMAGLLHDWDLRTRLRFATLSASVSVTGLGGATSAPSPAQLRDFVERERLDGDWTFLTELSE